MDRKGKSVRPTSAKCKPFQATMALLDSANQRNLCFRRFHLSFGVKSTAKTRWIERFVRLAWISSHRCFGASDIFRWWDTIMCWNGCAFNASIAKHSKLLQIHWLVLISITSTTENYQQKMRFQVGSVSIWWFTAFSNTLSPNYSNFHFR